MATCTADCWVSGKLPTPPALGSCPQNGRWSEGPSLSGPRQENKATLCQRLGGGGKRQPRAPPGTRQAALGDGGHWVLGG